MAIEVTVHCNDDDALIAWRPGAADWDPAWVGFMVEKKERKDRRGHCPQQPHSGPIGRGSDPSDWCLLAGFPFPTLHVDRPHDRSG